MAQQRTVVIPIRRDRHVSETDRQIVDLAYNLWLGRGFRDGSPEEDLLAAAQLVSGNKFGGDAA